MNPNDMSQEMAPVTRGESLPDNSLDDALNEAGIVDSPATDAGAQTTPPAQAPNEVVETPDADIDNAELGDEPAPVETTADPTKIKAADKLGTPAVTVAEPATTVAAPVAPTDPLEREFPTPKGMSPKNQVHLGNMRKIIGEQRGELQKVTQQLKEVQTHLQERPALDPNIEKELTELREWRLMMDVQSTEPFKQSYDLPIEQTDEAIFSVMRSLYPENKEVVENAINQIKTIGGIEHVSNQWWDLNVVPELQKRSSLDVNDFSNLLTKGKQLRAARASAVAQSKTKLQDHIKKAQAEKAEYHKQFAAVEQEEITKFMSQFQDAHFKEVPATATPEEKAAIEEHNRQFQVYMDRDAQMIKALQQNDPRVLTQMRLAANASFYFKDVAVQASRIIEQKEKEIAELQAKLNGIKGVTSMAKAGVAAPIKPTKPQAVDRLGMKDADAIDLGLDEALNAMR